MSCSSPAPSPPASSAAASSACSSGCSTSFQFARRPRSVLVVKKRGPGSEEVERAACTLVHWCISRRDMVVWMEQAEADDIAAKVPELQAARREAKLDAMSSDASSHSAAAHALPSRPSPPLPAGLYSLACCPRLLPLQLSLVDFCVSLGGDGTVLHLNAILNVLHTPLPPLLSFAMGTLGFLTNLYFEHYQASIDAILAAHRKGGDAEWAQRAQSAERNVRTDSGRRKDERGDGARMPDASPGSPHHSLPTSGSVTPTPDCLTVIPRQRLQCHIYRRNVSREGDAAAAPSASSHTFVGSYTCLNEVLVHRSSSPFLTSIDIQLVEPAAQRNCGNGGAQEGQPFYVTTVHADGLMAATPTGSTAYSMASGGPMIAPTSDCMLLCPVSPHSLSFRPIVLSAAAEVRFTLALNSRLGITERMVEGVLSVQPPPQQQQQQVLEAEAATLPPLPPPPPPDYSPPFAALSASASAAPARRWSAIVSCDGHYQVLLAPGDYVQFTSAPHPLTHINLHELSNDALWMHALVNKLHWSTGGQRQPLLEEAAHKGIRQHASHAHAPAARGDKQTHAHAQDTSAQRQEGTRTAAPLQARATSASTDSPSACADVTSPASPLANISLRSNI